jgi:hypothetical protein
MKNQGSLFTKKYLVALNNYKAKHHNTLIICYLQHSIKLFKKSSPVIPSISIIL